MMYFSTYFMVETESKSQKELDLKLILVYLWLAHTPHDFRIESWFNSTKEPIKSGMKSRVNSTEWLFWIKMIKYIAPMKQLS